MNLMTQNKISWFLISDSSLSFLCRQIITLHLEMGYVKISQVITVTSSQMADGLPQNWKQDTCIDDKGQTCDNHLTSLQIPGSTCRLGRCLLTEPAATASSSSFQQQVKTDSNKYIKPSIVHVKEQV